MGSAVRVLCVITPLSAFVGGVGVVYGVRDCVLQCVCITVLEMSLTRCLGPVGLECNYVFPGV